MSAAFYSQRRRQTRTGLPGRTSRDTIGVDPDAFFAELYGLTAGPLPSELAELQAMIGSIVNLLVKNDVVTAGAVARAVAAHSGLQR